MLELRKSKVHEASEFVVMESDQGTSEFIIPYSLTQHISFITSDELIYLSIYDSDELVGFMILVIHSPNDVEFRRIVIAKKGHGLGQRAITLMEEYCTEHLNCSRVWLDVFESNKRGINLYRKLGYKQFKQTEFEGQQLLFMEKTLTKVNV